MFDYDINERNDKTFAYICEYRLVINTIIYKPVTASLWQSNTFLKFLFQYHLRYFLFITER